MDDEDSMEEDRMVCEYRMVDEDSMDEEDSTDDEGIEGRFRVLLNYLDSEEQELENFFLSLKRNDDFLEKWKTMLRALIFMAVDFEKRSQRWNGRRERLIVDLWLYEV